MVLLREFETHNNGGRPYRVIIRGNHVEVLNNEEEPNFPISSFNCSKVFIGKSYLNDMTRFSGGYGSEFDGNSILLHLENNKYIFIGHRIFLFESLSPIIDFKSPVGNNDVPYPYAIDEENNYYLLIEDVIVQNNNNVLNYDDPYTYYYHASLITQDLAFSNPEPTIIQNFDDIKEYYIGEDRYTFRYHPYSEKDYDRLVPDLGERMYIVNVDGVKRELTKDMYVDLNQRFGNINGFIPLETENI